MEVITTELVLADVQTTDKRLPKMDKEARANPKLRVLVSGLQKARDHLDKGAPLHRVQSEFSDEEWLWLQKELQLITMKPVIYLFNMGEDELDNGTKKEIERAS